MRGKCSPFPNPLQFSNPIGLVSGPVPEGTVTICFLVKKTESNHSIVEEHSPLLSYPGWTRVQILREKCLDERKKVWFTLTSCPILPFIFSVMLGFENYTFWGSTYSERRCCLLCHRRDMKAVYKGIIKSNAVSAPKIPGIDTDPLMFQALKLFLKVVNRSFLHILSKCSLNWKIALDQEWKSQQTSRSTDQFLCQAGRASRLFKSVPKVLFADKYLDSSAQNIWVPGI